MERAHRQAIEDYGDRVLKIILATIASCAPDVLEFHDDNAFRMKAQTFFEARATPNEAADVLIGAALVNRRSRMRSHRRRGSDRYNPR